jgi:hypothetical protein
MSLISVILFIILLNIALIDQLTCTYETQNHEKIIRIFKEKKIEIIEEQKLLLHTPPKTSKYLSKKIQNSRFKDKIQKGEKIYTPVARRYLKRAYFVILREKGYVESLPEEAYCSDDNLCSLKNVKRSHTTQRILFPQNPSVTLCTRLEKEAILAKPVWQHAENHKKTALIALKKFQRINKINSEALENVWLEKILNKKDYKCVEVFFTQKSKKIFFHDKETKESIVQTFYYCPEFFGYNDPDPAHKDMFPKNIERLKNGENPIGYDHKSMHHHHATMYDDSFLVLISATLHTGKSLKRVCNNKKANLHLSKDIYKRPKRSNIHRAFFSQISTYANKCIAKACEALLINP